MRGYDVKSEEIARAFLEGAHLDVAEYICGCACYSPNLALIPERCPQHDKPTYTEEEVKELAQQVQDAIEMYLQYGRKRKMNAKPG